MAHRIRLRGRSVALIGAALLVAAAVCSPAAAQEATDYEHLLDTYAAGHLNEAVARLSRWPREHVTAAVRGIRRTSQAVPNAPSRLRAAAMLHTDLAAAVLSSDSDLSEFHLGLARGLIGLLAAKKEQASSAQEFVRRWYEFAPSLYLATRELERALFLVEEGRVRSPANPMMYLYGGEIIELRGAVPTTVITRAPRGFGTAPGRPEARLEQAAAEYRRALAVDGHFAVARLRLGRVHFQQHDSRARADLEAALADASDMATRYLAHLFLGAIAEREQRLADALREYEEARTVGPAYQTAYIAICRMADVLGDTDRARQAALALVGIEKHEDPWWDYQVGGLNMSALEWLRAAAQGS